MLRRRQNVLCKSTALTRWRRSQRAPSRESTRIFVVAVRMRSHELDFYSRFCFCWGGGGGGGDLEAQRTSIRGYRQTGQNRVFCEACHGKLVHSSLVFLFRTARVTTVQSFGKKIRSVSHFLQPRAIDKASGVKRKNVCKSKA